MRCRAHVCFITTMIIVLIWCLSIDWSNREQQSHEVYGREMEAVETHCEKRGLFKPHVGCCPRQDCSVDQISFHIRSGAANVIPPKICFNNTIVMGGVRNDAGQGLNIVLINGETGEVLRRYYFHSESADAEELFDFLKIVKPGNIILVASYVDPVTKLTDGIRDVFAGLGSTVVKSMKRRDNWVFAGVYGKPNVSPFEKLMQNDMAINAYGDWPEMGEIVGCFPRITEILHENQ